MVQNQKLNWKKCNFCSKTRSKTFEKNINNETKKIVKVLIYAMQNNISKIEGKHLIFKVSIAKMKTRLLINNGSKTEFIDEFFVHTNKILILKLEKTINFIFENGKIA